MEILIISYHFPPGKNSQAQHVINLAKFLSVKNSVNVLTAENDVRLHGNNGNSITNSNIKVYRINKGFLHRSKPKSKDTEATKRKENKFVKNKNISRLKKFLVPDSVIDWYPLANDWLSKKIYNFDIVISIATPYTDLLIGDNFIKKHSDKRPKHIVVYADPWLGEDSIKRSKLRSYLESRVENGLLKRADSIFMVTKNAKIDYIKRYPHIENKVNHYYLGHNIQQLKKPVESKRNKEIKMRYFGSIQSVHRDPFVLFDVLDNEKFIGVISFDMYLLPHASHTKIVERIRSSKNLKEIVKFMDPVDHNDMIKISAQEGINIIFGNKSIKQIPGKLFDYIGAQSVIFYLEAAFNNEVNTILENYNAAYISKNSHEDIKKNIEKIISNHEEFIKLEPSKDVYINMRTDFSYKNVQDEIDELAQDFV